MISASAEYSRLEPLQTRIETHRKYSELPDDVEQSVIDAAGIRRGDAVLDVGCGTGSFLARLRSEGHEGRLVGLDSSPAAIAAVSRADGVEAVLADAMRLPFADAEFDVVAARHMLYHVERPLLAIRESWRVLRVGGRFAATVNDAHTTPHLVRLVTESVKANGLTPPSPPSIRVHSRNLPRLVETAFGNVSVERHDNALIFATPQPLVAYVVALLSFYGVGGDTPNRPRVIRTIQRTAAAWFASHAAPWRDPKSYTVCVATRL